MSDTIQHQHRDMLKKKKEEEFGDGINQRWLRWDLKCKTMWRVTSDWGYKNTSCKLHNALHATLKYYYYCYWYYTQQEWAGSNSTSWMPSSSFFFSNNDGTKGQGKTKGSELNTRTNFFRATWNVFKIVPRLSEFSVARGGRSAGKGRGQMDAIHHSVKQKTHTHAAKEGQCFHELAGATTTMSTQLLPPLNHEHRKKGKHDRSIALTINNLPER